MKWTFDKGYQRFRSYNPLTCKFAYIDVQMRALADPENQWYYTDTDLIRAQIPVQFDDDNTLISPEEYEIGNRFVMVACEIQRWRLKDFESVMIMRDARLRNMCGAAYSDMVADLNAKLRKGKPNNAMAS